MNDPVGELAVGPSETWRPAARHLKRMDAWAKWMEMAGLPEWKARAWAFELWKIGQRAESEES